MYIYAQYIMVNNNKDKNGSLKFIEFRAPFENLKLVCRHKCLFSSVFPFNCHYYYDLSVNEIL